MCLHVSLEQTKILDVYRPNLGGSGLWDVDVEKRDTEDVPILAELPNLDKGVSVSNERFIKFIPSEEAIWLLKNKGHAFRLLAIIAEAARRYEGAPDGLNIGECFIGGHQNYDMTEQNYRTAKDILVMRQHLKILETSRTRKKSTNGVTTAGTKVKLLSSNVWDINIKDDNERSNEWVTNDQRMTNDKQEDKEYKEDKEKESSPQPLTGEGLSPLIPDGDNAPNPPSKKVLPKSRPKKEKAEKIEREKFVRTTETQHHSLIEKHGEVMVAWFYRKLSEWKIGKGIGDLPNDYRSISTWVIKAVENEIAKPLAPVGSSNWDKNQQFFREVMDNFPEKTEGMYFFYKDKILRHKGHSFDLSGEMPPADFERLLCKHLKIAMEESHG